MRKLLLCLIAIGATRTATADAPLIIVPASAATPKFVLDHGATASRPKPNGSAFPPGVTFSAFLAPEELTQILVEHFADNSLEPPLTPESIRQRLTQFLTEQGLGLSPGIYWSEGTPWSIQATLTFKSGKRATLITDGRHFLYEDPEGYRWFTVSFSRIPEQ